MLQRYDTSMRSPYRPPSLSLIAWRNHCCSVKPHSTKPAIRQYMPQPWPLIHWPAPKITNSRPVAVNTG